MNSTLEKCSKPSAVRKNPCLKSTTDKLYEQRHETGDIKFSVGSEEIPAHRCVLAALSPRYKAQFYGAMAEQKTINVQNESPAAFKEFLQFFYLDEVTLTLENIEDVLNLAKQSLVDELVSECTNFLLDVVGMDKLVWCYRLAIDYEIKPFDDFCVKQIGCNIKNVFQSQDFLSCDQEVLCHILELESLNCDEVDVFDACIAWAKTKCEHDGIDAASTAHLRTALGDAIFKIRFCSMAGDQFANINMKYSRLLQMQESNEVFQAILLKGSGKISSIFGANNSKPRKPIQSFMECSFSKGLSKRISYVQEFLDFTCDKAILLNGFVICNKIDDGIVVRVDIADVSRSFAFTKSTLDNETRIMFGNPIRVAGRKLCRIDIESESELLRGFKVKKSVRSNGVSFELGEAYKYSPTAITRLLYHSIE